MAFDSLGGNVSIPYNPTAHLDLGTDNSGTTNGPDAGMFDDLVICPPP